MTSGGPMMNGEVPHSPSNPGMLEETLHQMNILIQENRDLKESLRQTNLAMKERFEGLAAWREKQREERDFLESRLKEARDRMEALTCQNQELSGRAGEDGKPGGAAGGVHVISNQSAELDALRAQVARLQAEKNDLVALNSELQLKADQDLHDDGSFIEIIRVSDGGVDGLSEACGAEHGKRPDLSMTASRHDTEATVSQLLQSLRNETQRAELLQTELKSSLDRIAKLEERKSQTERSTQTEAEVKDEPSKEDKAQSEVESMKSQMKTLFKELQQAQSKLDEAEGMKKNLQDRCREVEQDVVALKAQLVEKQAVQTENQRLKLQLDSMEAQCRVEQRKAGEERNTLAQLKDAYTKLFEDYNELKEEQKKKETQMVQKELLDKVQVQLTAAEEALATKQGKIDQMKQEIFQKEKELETISVFQAQAEVYSSDFYAERAAREKLHEERERLATQLEYVKKQNTHLQEELDSMGRQGLNEMQRRHVGGNPHGAGASLVGRGTDWQHPVGIPEHACPKCNEILPDLDTLQIHIMDCIN
ncbi:optineurin [Takifugu flavidus]|uniref:Optineurin n=1 Tax=Takifugu flavidus TaxID=433684 RepID=A0A5C6NAF7_9TELE|nr:optineurin [Takifugu flavidus]TWW64462.1 Optineurin [Takifugu flavidus]